MKKLLSAIPKSIFTLGLAASLSMGMDAQEKLEPQTTPLTLKESLRPPQITYSDYALELVINGTFQGWEDMSGNLGVWLQKATNKIRVSNENGDAAVELSLLCLTPIPIIDNGRLRAEYSLPAPNSDIGPDTGPDASNSPPTLFLFLRATEDELKAVALLPRESPSDLASRILQWQNQNYRMTVTTKGASCVPASNVQNGVFPQIDGDLDWSIPPYSGTLTTDITTLASLLGHDIGTVDPRLLICPRDSILHWDIGTDIIPRLIYPNETQIQTANQETTGLLERIAGVIGSLSRYLATFY